MRNIKFMLMTVGVFLLCFQTAIAAENTLAGLWRSIDDETGKPRALIRINESNGVFSGTVEKGLLPTDTGDKVCDKCTDYRKDQPVIGMTIVNDMKLNGNKYDGGKILDPNNGKVYKCKMTLNDAGDELKVRGYIGISLLGRTQIWQRVE